MRVLLSVQEINNKLKTAMKKREFLQITLLNSQFHRFIHKASHNDYLINSLRNLESEYQRLAYLCFSIESEVNDLKVHFGKVIDDHSQLIGWLKDRDERSAVETITRHIHLFHSRVSKYLFPPMQVVDFAHWPYRKST